ncbi:MAG: ABC transporter ATP-binding protein [Acidobacteriota bacterium]|nr:ABC transporter ATP-binding protein [Acidobacteriota bacterium]
MIEAHDLTRRYGDFIAVDSVSFSVQESEIVGILGPNGAGKTTTIRMITGFLPPSRGGVLVNGKDLLRDSVGARREVGYLPEHVALYPEMRVSEYLRYRARLEGLSGADSRHKIDVVIERCLLSEVRHQIIGTLSKGYRQRVGLATAILHEPTVLVLDEPTVGLDPKQIVAIRGLIRELGRERTLLLSTHILPEVELLCDRVMIFDGGRIVTEGSPADLRESWSGNTRVHVSLKSPAPTAREVLENLDGVVSVQTGLDGDSDFTLECEGQVDAREAVFKAAVENRWTLLELHRSRASLEDVFVRLTTRDEAAQPAAMQSTEETAQ